MATVLGTYATKYADPTQANKVSSSYNGAKPQSFYDEYEASSLSANDLIAVGPKLPVGAMIVSAVIRFDALGASTTLQLGDAGDDDRYIAAASTSSAGTLSTLHIDNGFGYVVTGTSDTQLYIKLAGASGTGTIKIMVQYVIA